MPIGTAMTYVTIRVRNEMNMVSGTRSASSSAVGLLNANERPKSPRSTILPIQEK